MVEFEAEKKKKKPHDRWTGGEKKEKPKRYEKEFDYEKNLTIEKFRKGGRIETYDVKNDRPSRKAW